MLCCDVNHSRVIIVYTESITQACFVAAEHTLPHMCSCQQGRRIPGWSDRVQPLREKSLFGTTCGCPVDVLGWVLCQTA